VNSISKKSIATRWFVNSFAVVAVILLVLTVSAFFMLRQYYYGIVSQMLQSEANTIAGVLRRYHDRDGVISSNEIRRSIEEFDNKSFMELMALNPNGEVLLTSSGFTPEIASDFADFIYAREQVAREQGVRGSGRSIGVLRGEGGSERYMAVTVMLPSERYSAIRLVTSLTAIDRQVSTLTLFIGVFSVAVLFLLLLLGLYFIRSIVSPLRQIGNATKKLADGDFSVRVTKSKHNDEIGELSKVINHMADELEMSELLKNEFISSVSHELRTPLTAIRGWGETVNELRDDETTEKGMKVIIAETTRLTEMVEELLDFSRIQSGQLSLQMVDFEIYEELTIAVTVYAERANREGIALMFARGSENNECYVHGDKNRIRQVFLNVIDNAIKYSEEDTIVDIAANIVGEKIIISFKDSGCGIAKSDLSKVKLKFYKSNNTKRGSGIGLAVADEIIELHKGKLNIKSELGKGTTIEITLPIITLSNENDLERENNKKDEQ